VILEKTKVSIFLWKISYTYTNENPYCEAYTAENIAYKANFGVAEVKPVQLKAMLNQHLSSRAIAG
jgi:hypothetical protein